MMDKIREIVSSQTKFVSNLNWELGYHGYLLCIDLAHYHRINNRAIFVNFY